jgi:hypothetical protein
VKESEDFSFGFANQFFAREAKLAAYFDFGSFRARVIWWVHMGAARGPFKSVTPGHFDPTQGGLSAIPFPNRDEGGPGDCVIM